MKSIVKRALLPALLMALFWACAQALPDGVYAPQSVSFSGGTGRVQITCPEVRIEEGQAIATVVFSSPHYTRAELGGQTYPAEHDGDTSVFHLPVTPNEAVTFSATTTAMSAEHAVEYTLYVGLGDDGAPAGLTHVSSLALDYATGFSVDYYEGGYALIDIAQDARYLVVPEGKDAPTGLDPAIVVLRQPLDTVYLAATSAMALFDAMDALPMIRLSGTDASGWTVQGAVQAMERGDMRFAGKYSEPDFELLLREGCDLAIESTMILHTPKIKEMLELLGIPVMTDRSSYEPHPLGRTEWIKLYAVLAGKEEEAKAFFDAQADIVQSLAGLPNTEKTVAFFYMHTNGTAVVRGAADSIPAMIELAGGRYAFDDAAAASPGSASVQLTMEEFYSAAVNADYLVYNATIAGPISSMDELLAASELFADFKAVQEGNVFCTDSSLYQATDAIGSVIGDLHRMLCGEREGLTYLYPIE